MKAPESKEADNESTELKKEEKKDGDKEGEDSDEKGPVPVGNGGTTDQYSWTQTLSEVEVNIFIPDGVKGN